jgi:hypothetical protein
LLLLLLLSRISGIFERSISTYGHFGEIFLYDNIPHRQHSTTIIIQTKSRLFPGFVSGAILPKERTVISIFVQKEGTLVILRRDILGGFGGLIEGSVLVKEECGRMIVFMMVEINFVPYNIDLPVTDARTLRPKVSKNLSECLGIVVFSFQ